MINTILKTNEGSKSSFYILNTISLIGATLYVVLVSIILGADKLVLISYIIPLACFCLTYYLIYKNKFGYGLFINLVVSLSHASIVVSSYESQFLELVYLFIALIPWFPFNNLKLLKTLHLISFLSFLIFGFHFKNNNLFEITRWSESILIYFIMMSIVFIALYQFLTIFKKNNLKSSLAIIKKNKEIERQNELLKLNTKTLIQYEKEKYQMELSNKQKDLELLSINNQMKIKMKTDLVKELQKIKKNKSDVVIDIQTIIRKLKYQIDEEKNIDFLQNSIDIIGSDFYGRIKQQFPELTKSEIELLSLLKLKLSNKQIASQRNTSSNTINVALHRLKHKCNFNSNSDMKKFIEEF